MGTKLRFTLIIKYKFVLVFLKMKQRLQCTQGYILLTKLSIFPYHPKLVLQFSSWKWHAEFGAGVHGGPGGVRGQRPLKLKLFQYLAWQISMFLGGNQRLNKKTRSISDALKQQGSSQCWSLKHSHQPLATLEAGRRRTHICQLISSSRSYTIIGYFMNVSNHCIIECVTNIRIIGIL